jgi:hypothetical protein
VVIRWHDGHDIGHSQYRLYLGHGAVCGSGDAPVYAEYLVVDDGSEGEAVEALVALLPDVLA